jgi:cyanate permease
MFFFQLCAAYALSYWLPTLVRSFGVRDLMHVGLYGAIPGISGALTMIAASWSSDRFRERRFHYVVTVSIGAAGLLLATRPAESPPVLALILMGVGTGSAPVFWAIPPMFLAKSAAAAGIAFINSMSVIAGAVSPYGVGVLKERTGSLNPGLYMVAMGLLVAAALMLVFGPRREPAIQDEVIDR